MEGPAMFRRCNSSRPSSNLGYTHLSIHLWPKLNTLNGTFAFASNNFEKE